VVEVQLHACESCPPHVTISNVDLFRSRMPVFVFDCCISPQRLLWLLSPLFQFISLGFENGESLSLLEELVDGYLILHLYFMAQAAATRSRNCR